MVKVDYGENGVVAETEFGNTIRAKKMVYCNGFESTEIIREPFVKLLSTYAIVTEPMDEEPGGLQETLFWSSGDPYLYLRTTDDNRLLVGGLDEDFIDNEKRDSLLPEKAEQLREAVNRLFPGRDFRVDFSWAGTFGETKDGLPFIGAHPGFPSTYFLLGFGGNGITFSVTGARLISAMMKGEEPALAKAFRFGR
jgi:glycine/D-amino acid oxidase-like deaminating enzyme